MTTVDARQRFVDINLPGWLAARRYGMPAAMVERATQRRLLGDWRGASAAAHVDVCFSLDAVGRRYGTDVLARVGDDLLHLAPDLVRWHAPRHVRGGMGLLVENRTLILAEYGDGDAGARLIVRTPTHHERPQRLELNIVDSTSPLETGYRTSRGVGEDWTQSRYLWDARAADALRSRLGGTDRTPFFHRDGRMLSATELAAAREHDPVALTERLILLQDAGEIEAAWRLGGVQVEVPTPDSERYPNRDKIMPETFAAMVPMLAQAARAQFGQPSAPGELVLRPQYGWGSALLVLSQRGADLVARRSVAYTDWKLPALPRPLWQRFPDLELLRTGQVTAKRVHPLVRAALFPDQPDPGYEPLPLPTLDAVGVSVRCRGEWHRLGWHGGRVTHLDHTEQEAAREKVMRSLGGPVPACFTVLDAWQGGATSRLPGRLRRLRVHGLTAVMHGRTDELLRLLDAGISPAGIIDRWASGPLDHLAKMDDPVALLPRLLATGLDINARNRNGRTPLGGVLFDGGSAELVRAMLDAGADPAAVDSMGNSTLHLVRSQDAERIVPWLVAAGVDLDAYNEYGRTPLMTQVIASAPAAAPRATLDAGADPGRQDEYEYMTVIDAVEEAGRVDLDFLVSAARAAGARSERDDEESG